MARPQISASADRAAGSRETTRTNARRGSVILVSEKDQAAMEETLFLLSIPGMGDAIRKGLKTPVRNCACAPPLVGPQLHLTGSDQAFRAAVSPEEPENRVGIEENHFLGLKVTPPRDEGSNVHCPGSTAGSTHSRVMAALGAFFRGSATESR